MDSSSECVFAIIVFNIQFFFTLTMVIRQFNCGQLMSEIFAFSDLTDNDLWLILLTNHESQYLKGWCSHLNCRYEIATEISGDKESHMINTCPLLWYFWVIATLECQAHPKTINWISSLVVQPTCCNCIETLDVTRAKWVLIHRSWSKKSHLAPNTSGIFKMF